MNAVYACSVHVESDVEQPTGLDSFWQGLVCFHFSLCDLISKAAGLISLAMEFSFSDMFAKLWSFL
jgi:hypothetical protein